MSIINDALKKIDKNSRQAHPQKQRPQPKATRSSSPRHHPPGRIGQAPEETRPSKTSASNSPAGLAPIMIALLLAAFAIYYIFLRPLPNRTVVTSPPPPTVPVQVKKPEAPLEPASPAKADLKDKIKIKGIMMMADKNVVLINDEIYEIGDILKGYEIIDISMDKIQLQKGTQIKSLKVKKR